MRCLAAGLALAILTLVPLLHAEEWQTGDTFEFPQPRVTAESKSFLTAGEFFIVEPTFADDGSIENVNFPNPPPDPVRQYVANFIGAHWHCPSLAGLTISTEVECNATTPVRIYSMSRPPYPQFAWSTGEEGTVMLTITFDAAGHVKECRIFSSTAPTDLANSARKYVVKNWRWSKGAGQTIRVPIVFTLHPEHSKTASRGANASDFEFPRPPVPEFGNAEGIVSYRGLVAYVTVVFGPDGSVKDCTEWLANSPMLSKYTCDFVRSSWHTSALAGKTVYAEILYGLSGPVPVAFAPTPPYPDFALAARESGTVEVTVAFDKGGNATSCVVTSSNLSARFGTYVCGFILKHWKDTPWTMQTAKIPLTYEYMR